MSHFILLFSIIFLQFTIEPLQALKRCNFSECNHEGECYEENNEKWCKCIGSNYFKGPHCSEVVDKCQMQNPCGNGGKCKNVVGQFVCDDCDAGFGGLWCDLQVSNTFDKMLLYFNHYAYYGEEHKFLIMVESLGEEGFSLELVSENYVIAIFETKSEETNHWTYSEDLIKLIEQLGIRYYNDLPYTKGYYHIASESFWNVGVLELMLRSYDSQSANQLFYQNEFSLLSLSHHDECVPDITFIYGTNPLDPLMLDIASYNNFEILLKKHCFEKSKIIYYWSVYDSIGTVKLHDFGFTLEMILKVSPYKLWFNYRGEVMSSYILVARMVEQYQNYKKETQARCFIYVLPKPVKAVIKGGHYREIGVNQSLVLDATNSRDFALDPNILQDIFYTWNCYSENDTTNPNCQQNISSSSLMRINANELQVHIVYNFTLSISSKVNVFISDETYQIVKIMESFQLNIDIKCLRNCLRNEFVQKELMHLRAEPLEGEIPKAATYKWTLADQIIGEKANLIYTTKEDDFILNIQLVVQDATLSCKTFKNFKVNLPPANGLCAVEPAEGQAILTDFHIKCKNYYDKDTPLNYEYMLGNRFPLQRTNEAEIHTKLPQCNEIVIKICDQFQACREIILEVAVKELEDIGDIKKVLKEQEGGLKNILERGDVSLAMIALKSISKFINTTEDVEFTIEEMKDFRLKTLLQMEQFLEISESLVLNNLPLSAKKAYAFAKYFNKLQQGLKTVTVDDEIKSFKKRSYEKSCQEILLIMQQFSQTWQVIPPVQTLLPSPILSSNPLVELNPELPDFDIHIAEQLQNWLHTAKTIQDCFSLMSGGAKELYIPWEDIFSVEKIDFYVLMYAFDSVTEQNVDLSNNAVNIILNEACVRELKGIYQNEEVLVQAVFLNANPFWWYPSETPLNSEVFLLTALSRKNSRTVDYLKNPFEFQLNLRVNNYSLNQIVGVMKNNLHMPIYVIEIPANAVLVVTFLWLEKPLRILIKFNKPPRSPEVHDSGIVVKNTNKTQFFNFLNTFNKNSQAFVAVLLVQEYKNVKFSFHSEIRQCLQWDYSLKEPQWSSQNCKPKLENISHERITCYCHHFSFFAAKSYESVIQEDLRSRWLLKELPISNYMVGMYLILFITFTFILLFNIYQYKNHQEFLPLSTGLSFTLNNDLEVRIFTGSHFNATTTSNISLRFISKNGSVSFTIYQNPDKPFLKKNSMCRFFLSSKKVETPSSVTISSDQSGRYASWFCHKIIITNLKTLEKQIFLVDQWIFQEPREILAQTENGFDFTTSFCQHLSNIYINWYQFEPIWGCWVYYDLNRLERCCIELSVLVASICVVDCYYGCTTLETYEQERDTYYFLHFNILELFILSGICFLLNCAIKFMFFVANWLCYDINVKHKKKPNKIV